MASGGGYNSTKQEKEEKDRNQGATTAALAVGATLAVGAAAAWGISKWGSSDPEPPHKEMKMEALGSSEIAWLGSSDHEPAHNETAWLGSSDPQPAPKERVTKAPAIDIIDHELPYDTHNTYDVVFFGESVHTTVAWDPTVVSDWISEVESSQSTHRCLHNLIVGLDVEWRPSYSRIENPAATLQICVGRKCLIFQLIHSPSVPPSLINFLSNPSYTFVGIAISQDLEKLEEDYGFGFNTKTVDLRGLAAAKYGRRDLKNAGLKTLASLVLEKEVDKPKSVTMSRWDNQWLTPSQVRYACVDAFVCSEIGRNLNASSATSARR